ncbi:hypothetical protein ALNOE001_08300 [Candidatus Methanobinarius endosymbioticus]|uniref:DUF4367 domain-containing protein n=1 Tax=Candidatus Methanobinarius endosymbioticus TaxID=2006182 RepID=A0A366MBI9_9EURY|nr:hypothetical protein ALNOE001_08300 [Candidatus Methanobinarius endosymbioticus]
MKSKFLAIIIVAIIAVIALGAAFTLCLGSNGEPSDSSSWEVRELSGIKFKVPQKHESENMLSGNIIDGVKTGDMYQSEDLTISINDTNWTSELNKFMNTDSNSMTVLDANGTKIKTFSADGTSVAFFEINKNKIAVNWSGDINGDIKAIIFSFFQENK